MRYALDKLLTWEKMTLEEFPWNAPSGEEVDPVGIRRLPRHLLESLVSPLLVNMRLTWTRSPPPCIVCPKRQLRRPCSVRRVHGSDDESYCLDFSVGYFKVHIPLSLGTTRQQWMMLYHDSPPPVTTSSVHSACHVRWRALASQGPRSGL